MARCLAGEGVRRGAIVGIYLERGIEMVVAMLATLKAGAGYMMLDREFPLQRLRDMIEDAPPAVVVVHGEADMNRLGVAARFVCATGDSGQADAGQALPHGAGGAEPEDIACMIFTSGSTGRQ